MSTLSTPDLGGQSRDTSALIVGIAAIVVGIVWNEAVLGGLFSPDGSVDRLSWRLAIGLFNGALIAFGIFTIVRGIRFPEMAVRVVLIIASLSACTGLLIAADMLVGRVSPPPPSLTFPEPLNLNMKDEHGILQGVPGRHRALGRSSAGGKLYDVTYTIDPIGRRETPIVGAGQRDRHLVFMGGSYTFGQGVEDDETFPYYVGELTTRYRPYNYGWSGGAPADALMKFQLRRISAEVNETRGLLIYLFIDGHIGRTIGSMVVTGSWGAEKIHYDLTPAGDLVFRGSFATAHPLRTYLYRKLSRTNIARLVGVDLPLYSTRHAVHTARILEALSAEYMREFPEGEFWVVLYPGREGPDDLIREFEARQIKYLHYPIDPDSAFFQRIPVDTHPTAAAYRALADNVVVDLGLE
jgi:hypothetical protein